MPGCPWCPRLYLHQELLRLFNVLQGPSGFIILFSIIGKITSNNQNQIQHLALEEEQGGVGENQFACSGEALNTLNKDATVCQSVSLNYYFLL